MEKLKKKKNGLKLVLAILIILIIALSIGIWFLVQNNKEGNQETENEETSDTQEVLEFSDEEYEEYTAENYIKWVNNDIEETTDLEEKASLYMDLAGQLYNFQLSGEGDYKDIILESSYKAESIYPTSNSAYNIYMFESEFGNKEKALEYLNIAKERGYEDVYGEG